MKLRRLRPFACGALTFLASQVLIRLPLIEALLPKWAGYVLFTARHPLAYCLFLGLTAGIFEEGARFLAAAYLLKRGRGFGDAVAFGLGHGGLEAALVLIPAALSGAGLTALLPAIIERILAVIIHVGLSVMVFSGFHAGSTLPRLLAAVSIHAALDALCGILPMYGASLLLTECVIAAFSAAMLIYTSMAAKVFSREKGETEV